MTRDFIVGSIFIIALALVGGLTFVMQEFPSGSSLELQVGFEDVSGMKSGDPVRVRGLRAGVVDEIVLDQKRGLAVATVVLAQELNPREGYEFKVLPASALGGSYLRYTPGTGALSPIDNLRGLAGGDVLGEVGDLLNNTKESIESGLDSLASLLQKLDSGEGIFGGLLTSADAKKQFLNTVENLESLTQSLRDGEGIMGSVIREGSDQQIRFNRLLTNMDTEMGKISAGEGTLGLILNDEKTRSEVRSFITQLSESMDNIYQAKGLLGRAINDPDFAQAWIDISSDFKNASEQLGPEGMGLLARLLHSKNLADDLSSSIAAIKTISNNINEGPGTLYNLIKDPSLFNEARQTLTLLRDSTEDLREQEPVTAFFSILFSPF